MMQNKVLSQEEIEVASLIRVLLYRKWLVVLVTVFVVLGTAGVSLFLKPRYESTARWLPSQGNSSSNLSGLAALAGVNLGSGVQNAEIFYGKILSAPSFLESLLQKSWPQMDGSSQTILEAVGIDTVALLANRKPWVTREILLRKAELAVIQRAILLLQETDEFVLTVTTVDPLMSQAIADSLIAKLQMYNETQRSSKARTERLFFEKQLVEFESDLRRKEGNLLRFLEVNKVINSPSLLMQERRLTREVEAAGYLVGELKKQMYMAKANEARETESLQIIQAPERPQQKAFPQRRLLVVISFFCGLILGCITAFLVHWWQRNKSFLNDNTGLT